MQTLGDRLREARLGAGFALTFVSAELSIPVSVLEAMENDDHDSLPAACFLQGFTKSYAEFLGLDAAQLMLWNEEEIQKPSAVKSYKWPTKKISINFSKFLAPLQWVTHSEVLAWGSVIAIILASWFGYSTLVGSKQSESKSDVQASTMDLRLEKMKSNSMNSSRRYRTNLDPAALQDNE